jgi:predicted permease
MPTINMKLALRALFRSPFVTIVAIVSLALGIGVNAAIFSYFHQMLLQPLPVHDPQRLVNLSSAGPKQGTQSTNMAGDVEHVFSYPMFRDLEKAQEVFTGMAAHRGFSANLSFRGETASGRGMLVSGSYFPALGLLPAHGRLLDPGDDRVIGESPVAVLSHDYWRTRFNEDPSVIGEALVVNGHPLTIVGVAPRGFEGTSLGMTPRVFVPITMRLQMEPTFGVLDDRRAYWAYVFARLAPGVSMEQAQTVINVLHSNILNEVEAPLQQGMSDQTMALFRAKKVTLADGRRGQSGLHEGASAPLTLLLCVTSLLLLIACANIANLLLARAASRSGEMAVRLSLGAGRGQLVTQLMSESLVLAAIGGIASLVVAHWTMNLVAWLVPEGIEMPAQPQLDATILLFSAALALSTGVLFGLFPALHSARADVVSVLKGQSGQPSGSRGAARFRTVLATAQIALSMALLVSAGLFTRSLYNLSHVDVGIRLDNVVTFTVRPQLNGYTAEQSLALFERLEEELAAIPGVTGVSAALVPALGGDSWGNNVSVEGFDAGPDTDTNARYNAVASGYFTTLDVPLLAGRDFTSSDAASSAKVAIVNEEFARKFNLGRDAVGRRMARGAKRDLDMEIIGIVRDTRYSQVREPPPPLFFVPYRQVANIGALSFYLRAAVAEEQVLSAIPRVVSRLDANLPVDNLWTMRQQAQRSFFADRLVSVLTAGFAGLATLLAAVGLYGVIAYTLAQRTREIGLRMALGATPGRVRKMVLVQVGWMALVGGVVGLAGALVIGRAAQSLLYELEGHDPMVLFASAVALAGVAAAAGLIPAYRASRVDPMLALRYE